MFSFWNGASDIRLANYVCSAYLKSLNTFSLKAEFRRSVVMSSHVGEMHLLVNDKEDYHSEGSSGFISVWIKIAISKNAFCLIYMFLHMFV